MDKKIIEKFVKIKPLDILKNPKGDIFKIINRHDKFYSKFGELYLTTIKENLIKGWKFHKIMKMNLVVPVGRVKFVFYCPNINFFYEVEIGIDNYMLLNINPKIWFGFKGMDKGTNLILNFSNIVHEDSEVLNKELNQIDYKW